MGLNHLKDQFLLQKDVTYLNFGAFGACPKPIFDVYQNFQRELEEEPTLFINELGPAYLKKSKPILTVNNLFLFFFDYSHLKNAKFV